MESCFDCTEAEPDACKRSGPGGHNAGRNTMGWLSWEDEMLCMHVAAFGKRWQDIALEINDEWIRRGLTPTNRTRASVRARYARLNQPCRAVQPTRLNKCTICKSLRRGHSCAVKLLPSQRDDPEAPTGALVAKSESADIVWKLSGAF